MTRSFGSEPVVEAWRQLAGMQSGGSERVVVNPESWLAPRGWVGIVLIGDVLIATVPQPELRAVVADALQDLARDGAATIDAVLACLPQARATLGPAQLLYPPPGFEPPAVEDADGVPADDANVAALLAAATPEDVDESGLASIESAAFVSRGADGMVACGCGYRRWPNGVAHISVLTDARQRGLGHGRVAASAAVAHACAEGLLPQWRTRSVASERLARSLGLVRMGVQVSLQL